MAELISRIVKSRFCDFCEFWKICIQSAICQNQLVDSKSLYWEAKNRSGDAYGLESATIFLIRSSTKFGVFGSSAL